MRVARPHPGRRENRAGGYARLEPTRVSEEVCDLLRPAVPTSVRAEAIGDFNEAAWVQNVRVSWTQPDGPGNVDTYAKASRLGRGPA